MECDTNVDRIVGSAYDVYAGPVCRYLTSITRDAAAAEDLTQDAFLRLTIEVGAGRIPDDIGGWLHRVGHNLAMSRARRRAVADRHLGELVRLDVAPSPEVAAIRNEAHRAAAEALHGLAPAHQRALVMAAYGIDGPARSEGAHV